MGSYGKLPPINPEVAAATIQTIGGALSQLFTKRPAPVQTFQAPPVTQPPAPESNLPSNTTLFLVGGAALGLILVSSVLRSATFRRY